MQACGWGTARSPQCNGRRRPLTVVNRHLVVPIGPDRPHLLLRGAPADRERLRELPEGTRRGLCPWCWRGGCAMDTEVRRWSPVCSMRLPRTAEGRLASKAMWGVRHVVCAWASLAEVSDAWLCSVGSFLRFLSLPHVPPTLVRCGVCLTGCCSVATKEMEFQLRFGWLVCLFSWGLNLARCCGQCTSCLGLRCPLQYQQ